MGNTTNKAVRENGSNDAAAWKAIKCIKRYGYAAGCAWTASELSKAEVAKAAATALKTANTENTAALNEYIERSKNEV